MPSRTDLMQLGRRYADNPIYSLSVETGPDGEKFLRNYTPLPDAPKASSFIVVWATEWARLAFPVIQSSHMYAAALMATVPPADIEIRPPWSVFYLSVPDGLVTLLNRHGEPEPVTGMLVHYDNERWTWLATARTVEFSRVCYPLEKMREEPRDDDAVAWGELLLDSEDHDQRASFCLSRLLVNTCLAMSDPSAVRAVGKAHGWRVGNPLPTSSRTFELGRPVRVDCRQSVRDYIKGGTRLTSVQWLVRGHWRNQAHGPAHSKRRMQWIEPFWKGGDDAPLNVRDHVLK